jgi:hypothetical protein
LSLFTKQSGEWGGSEIEYMKNLLISIVSHDVLSDQGRWGVDVWG